MTSSDDRLLGQMKLYGALQIGRDSEDEYKEKLADGLLHMYSMIEEIKNSVESINTRLDKLEGKPKFKK